MSDHPEKLELPDEVWIKPLISARRSYPCPQCGSEARLLVDIETNFPVYNSFGHWQYHCLSCDQQFSVDLRDYVVEKAQEQLPDSHDSFLKEQ